MAPWPCSCAPKPWRDKLGITPLGRLVSHAYTGCDPARMGLGPVKAMQLALQRAGWKLDDADIVEINEAFAAQTLAVLKCLKDKASASAPDSIEPLGELDESRLNPQGGAIALGHPGRRQRRAPRAHRAEATAAHRQEARPREPLRRRRPGRRRVP